MLQMPTGRRRRVFKGCGGQRQKCRNVWLLGLDKLTFPSSVQWNSLWLYNGRAQYPRWYHRLQEASIAEFNVRKWELDGYLNGKKVKRIGGLRQGKTDAFHESRVFLKMSGPVPPRWHQRLKNFSNALSQLQEACSQETYSKLERAGLVQTFQFSFELGWKSLRDLLYHEGLDASSPRTAIRLGFEARHLNEDDCRIMLDALDKRNRLSHTYNDELAREAERLIKEDYYPVLYRLDRKLKDKMAA